MLPPPQKKKMGEKGKGEKAKKMFLAHRENSGPEKF